MNTLFSTINDSVLAEAGNAPVHKYPAPVSAPVSAQPPRPANAERVTLPQKGPLLTRNGWSVVCAAGQHH